MEEKLTQEEIDHLTQSIKAGEDTITSAIKLDSVKKKIMEKYNSFLATQKRYDFALANREPFIEIEHRKQEVHKAAHRLWLANHELDKDSFLNLMLKHWDGWIARGCPSGRKKYGS